MWHTIMKRTAAGLAAAAAMSGASTTAFAADPSVPVRVEGVDYVAVAAIFNRLKCDIWAAAEAAKADGRQLVSAEGKLTVKASVDHQIEGGLGVEVAVGGYGGALGGSVGRGHGRVRTIEIPFKAEPTTAPTGTCLRVRSRGAPTNLGDERLFEYVGLGDLRDDMSPGGATITLQPVQYSGEFVLTRTAGADGSVTILVFKAKGEGTEPKKLTQEFELKLNFRNEAPTIFKSR